MWSNKTSMTKGIGLVFLVLAASLVASYAQLIAEEPSGILVIGGVQVNVDIPTRVGCREVIRCLGNGSVDSLRWRRFSLRGFLMSGENRIVDIMTDQDPDMDGIFSYVSHLVFDPVRLTDSGSFTCTIDSQGTHTARVRVEPDLAEISTTNHDLSIRIDGDMMSIYCTVDSCVPDLTVQLLRDDVVQVTRVRRATAEFMPMEDPFNLTVSASIVGQYNCRVVGTFMGESFIIKEYFNITGNPQPRPTTAAPPPGDGGGNGGGNGGSNNDRGSASKLHTSLAITLVAALLLLPLLVL